MKDETKFTRTLLEWLRRIDRSWWEKIQQVSISGTPDILGCRNGRFVGLEVKVDERSKVSELQLHKLLLIRRAGGYGEIVHKGNVERVLKEINELE